MTLKAKNKHTVVKGDETLQQAFDRLISKLYPGYKCNPRDLELLNSILEDGFRPTLVLMHPISTVEGKTDEIVGGVLVDITYDEKEAQNANK